MSFKSQFTVDGKNYRVFHCSYSLQQDVDKSGRPSSEGRSGTIQLEIESTGDTAHAAWMIDDFKMKDRTITFYKKDSEQKLKELGFKNGYLVGYTEAKFFQLLFAVLFVESDSSIFHLEIIH